jgi:hypothetical protein
MMNIDRHLRPLMVEVLPRNGPALGHNSNWVRTECVIHMLCWREVSVSELSL